ncbi:hypothetical protein [Micromonospora sp. NPDC005413]
MSALHRISGGAATSPTAHFGLPEQARLALIVAGSWGVGEPPRIL